MVILLLSLPPAVSTEQTVTWSVSPLQELSAFIAEVEHDNALHSDHACPDEHKNQHEYWCSEGPPEEADEERNERSVDVPELLLSPRVLDSGQVGEPSRPVDNGQQQSEDDERLRWLLSV